MTETELKPTYEEIMAADTFRSALIPRADAANGFAPLWHGWAIAEAFFAGIRYARALPDTDRVRKEALEEAAQAAEWYHNVKNFTAEQVARRIRALHQAERK